MDVMSELQRKLLTREDESDLAEPETEAERPAAPRLGPGGSPIRPA